MSATKLRVCGSRFLLALAFAGCSPSLQPAPKVTETPPLTAPTPELDPIVDITPALAPTEVVEPIEAGADPQLSGMESPADSAPGERLQEALDLYELATQLWTGGDLDATLELLDRAYALMASVDPGADTGLAQDKESLRRLLARRIVELYAARRNGVGNEHEAIPLELHPEVEREIHSFQTVEREPFLGAYERSGLYRPMILEELRKANLPEGLSWLPLVESLFKERALSSARAAGLWQFIASTGYRYSLRRTEWFDERFDPLKSTRAAIAYLSDLHALFGDWLTALAAYNCGEGTILRELKRQSAGYFDRFWDLYARLPQETRRYVPRLIATLLIVQDPGRFGFVLPKPLEPPLTETVEVARSISFEVLERHLGLPSHTLAQLNPELRRNATPPSSYALRVPAGAAPRLLASLDILPAYQARREAPPRVAGGTHRVRSGETLTSIASRYGVSSEALARTNGLSNPHQLSVGQLLRIPGRTASTSRNSAPSASVGKTTLYRVQPGDNLWAIASRFGVSVEQLKADNRLVSNLLQPGQILTVRSSG